MKGEDSDTYSQVGDEGKCSAGKLRTCVNYEEEWRRVKRSK